MCDSNLVINPGVFFLWLADTLSVRIALYEKKGWQTCSAPLADQLGCQKNTWVSSVERRRVYHPYVALGDWQMRRAPEVSYTDKP